jgi:hypothetical protein
MPALIRAFHMNSFSGSHARSLEPQRAEMGVCPIARVGRGNFRYRYFGADQVMLHRAILSVGLSIK